MDCFDRWYPSIRGLPIALHTAHPPKQEVGPSSPQLKLVKP